VSQQHLTTRRADPHDVGPKAELGGAVTSRPRGGRTRGDADASGARGATTARRPVVFSVL